MCVDLDLVHFAVAKGIDRAHATGNNDQALRLIVKALRSGWKRQARLRLERARRYHRENPDLLLTMTAGDGVRHWAVEGLYWATELPACGADGPDPAGWEYGDKQVNCLKCLELMRAAGSSNDPPPPAA